MPYIDQPSRTAIANNMKMGTRTEGDACYLYAVRFFELYKASPKWRTIHFLRKLVKFPHLDEGMRKIEDALGGIFTPEDREVARDLAFIEFYRRIAALHEDIKCLENGDVFDATVIPTQTSAVKKLLPTLHGS